MRALADIAIVVGILVLFGVPLCWVALKNAQCEQFHREMDEWWDQHGGRPT